MAPLAMAYPNLIMLLSQRCLLFCSLPSWRRRS